MKSSHQRRRPRMIRQTVEVLALICVLLHLVGWGHAPVVTAEQSNEANESNKSKTSLSEQFIRSLSVTKGSDRRDLQLQKNETTTPRSTKERHQKLQRMAGLSPRMQKQRTIQRWKGKSHVQKRRNVHPDALYGGGRGDNNGKWNPAGWNGSSNRERHDRWRPGRWHSGGGDWYSAKTPSWGSPSSWGSPWGDGWGGRVNTPGFFPTKREL